MIPIQIQAVLHTPSAGVLPQELKTSLYQLDEPGKIPIRFQSLLHTVSWGYPTRIEDLITPTGGAWNDSHPIPGCPPHPVSVGPPTRIEELINPAGGAWNDSHPNPGCPPHPVSVGPPTRIEELINPNWRNLAGLPSNSRLSSPLRLLGSSHQN